MIPQTGSYFSHKMKIVRETLESKKMDFERTGDPMYDLDLGMEAKIQRWLEAAGIEDYELNDDLSVNVFKDVDITNKELETLPAFIKFGTVYGGFYAGGNHWKSLGGFPDAIEGDLQLRSPANPDHYTQQEFTNDEIEKLIKVDGKIYN